MRGREENRCIAPIVSDDRVCNIFNATMNFLTLQIVRDAETLSARMNHRGACACDNDTGDGAGVLCAIPHDYYAAEIRLAIARLPTMPFPVFITDLPTDLFIVILLHKYFISAVK